ncbi:MAG: N-acetyltransferase [Actinomycetota bacterium]|nr:N-acetyltransferase [Actinomycetota bacterium]
MSTPTVVNNPENSRYEISVDGKLAGFTEYVDTGGLLVFPHTQVFDEFDGQGLGAILVTGALDDVRANGRLIRADCPYVRRFLREHPEYKDLLA